VVTDRLRRLLPAATFLAVALVPVVAAAQGTGTLSGTVTDRDGQGLQGITVTATPAECEADCPDPAQARTSITGEWTLPDLQSGTYTVAADDPDDTYLPASADARVNDNTTTTVELRMTRGAMIMGTVSGTDADALADIRVTATLPGATAPTATTASAGDGSYALQGLPPETYTVTFTAPDGRYHPHEVELQVAEESVTDLDVELALARVPAERIAGEDRILTAVQASRRGFPDGAATVVIASADAFPDALTAAPLAGEADAPVLLVGARLPAAVEREIARLGAQRAVIVGGIAAVNAVVQSELHHGGLEVERIAGENRFDTTGLIAREVGLPASGEIAVAYGGNFADALSVAPLAAAEGLPVLLTDRAALPRDTAETLAALQPRSTFVLGGTSAISGEVAGRFPNPTRIAGATRYETSARVAELFVSRSGEVDTVYAATGRDFPDAIVAGPVAARTFGPLLLVDGRVPDNSPATFAFLRDHAGQITEIVVFGGPRAVSDEALDQLSAAAAARPSP
jgi:putative cell wall-binding protein